VSGFERRCNGITGLDYPVEAFGGRKRFIISACYGFLPRRNLFQCIGFLVMGIIFLALCAFTSMVEFCSSNRRVNFIASNIASAF